MHTPLLEPVQPTQGVKYFRGKKSMVKCLRYVLAAKDSGRFISAGTRIYGGQDVLYVNHYLRSR